jgi:Rrf2 family transcriptional regulator, iron-sulfur cluster assembly transcription factor
LDLQLTRRGDYTMRAALALARAAGSGEYVKLREVSEQMDIPLRYTQEILTILMRGGLAEARAGRQGGYRLLRAPRDISVLDVVEAAEGPLRSDRCTLSGGPCHWQDTVCAVHSTWVMARESLTSVLRQQTLQDVLEADNELQASSQAAVANLGAKRRARPSGSRS